MKATVTLVGVSLRVGMAFSASWSVPPACGTCCFAPNICSLLPRWLADNFSLLKTLVAGFTLLGRFRPRAGLLLYAKHLFVEAMVAGADISKS
jgi:hypothetical protein